MSEHDIKIYELSKSIEEQDIAIYGLYEYIESLEEYNDIQDSQIQALNKISRNTNLVLMVFSIGLMLIGFFGIPFS